MSKTWAIILSIIGGLLLLAMIAVGGFVYWFYQNKGRLVQTAERFVKEAKAFGVATDNEGCVREALARHKRDKSFTGRISTQGFLTACLEASRPSPGFCDGVPPQSEIMSSASWSLKRCSEAGLPNDQGCQQIFGAVRAHCHRNKNSPER